MNLGRIKKAIAAAVGTVTAGVAAAYATDSVVSTEEWISILLAAAATVFAVYKLKNTD